MLEFAALTYGALASFIMASVDSNRRAGRRHPPILTLFGFVMMAFSLVMGTMLIGYVGISALTAA